MEILFLGTSSGAPTRDRNVSGAALRRHQSRRWYLIDCGEATQHRLLVTPLSINSLHAIFITHVHGDHCYGLPGLLGSAAMAGRTEPLWIVAPREIQEFLEVVQRTTQLRLTFPLHFKSVEDQSQAFPTLDFDVEAVELSHRVPSYAYAFTEIHQQRELDAQKLRAVGLPPGPLWGQLRRGIDVELADGRKLAAADFFLPPRRSRKVIIAGDNDTPELLRNAAVGADLLVHEATYTADIAKKVGAGPGHSYAAAVAQFAAAARIPSLILTHFSARYQRDPNVSPSITDIEAEARESYHGNLFLANDLDVFLVDRTGSVSRVTQ
jgi:ribonuclease Z